MKKSTLILLLLFVYCRNISAQTVPISIGSQFPNVSLPKIRHYDKVGPGKLGSYFGKLLILDYWATWCGPCVNAVPKLEKLSATFRKDLHILAVTDEKDETVGKFYRKLFQDQQIKGLSVTEDTILHQLMPYNYRPTYVWIDPAGVVRGITENDQVTETNIRNAITGDFKALKNIVINQEKLVYELSSKRNLFSLSNSFKGEDEDISRNVPDSLIDFRSVATRYLPNIKGGMKWDSTGIYATNVNASFLYKNVFALVTEQKYSSVFFAPAGSSWK